jgi:hypothetical protein
MSRTRVVASAVCAACLAACGHTRPTSPSGLAEQVYRAALRSGFWPWPGFPARQVAVLDQTVRTSALPTDFGQILTHQTTADWASALASLRSFDDSTASAVPTSVLPAGFVAVHDEPAQQGRCVVSLSHVGLDLRAGRALLYVSLEGCDHRGLLLFLVRDRRTWQLLEVTRLWDMID